MATRPDERTKTIQHYCYCLTDSIGKGFSSVVYKGKNKLNGQPVAIKVIDLHKLSQSTLKQLLHSQINIIKSLDHINVLKCENVYMTVNNCYIITQLCRGGDLASEIKKKGRLRGIEALQIMLQIAKGVAHLSELNIVHRDIKPANILLHEGRVKLADFGFARYQQQQVKKEKYNVGSPLYMSPEAIFSNFYSKQNDLWSLGIVFYQIIQGRPPWDPKNQKQLKQILKQKKQLFFRIAVRDELETIIRGCLNHDRLQRLTIKSIIQILQKMMQEMTKQDNTPYRQTLTKRNHVTVSCKDLNMSTTLSTQENASTRLVIPKLSRPPLTQTAVNKQNSKKQIPATPINEHSVMSRNRSAVELKQKQQILTLEQSSRHNHFILKSVINFARLIFKTYPRIDKMQCKQPTKLQLQSIMVSLLQHFIAWLKDTMLNPKIAEGFGIINFEKFRQTKCYSKTVLVINQYYDRYIKFITKTKKMLQEKRMAVPDQKRLPVICMKLKKMIEEARIHPSKSQHNIAVDFLMSITILVEMLETKNIPYFADHSYVEQIVETQPIPLIRDAQINELNDKWEALIKLN